MNYFVISINIFKNKIHEPKLAFSILNYVYDNDSQQFLYDRRFHITPFNEDSMIYKSGPFSVQLKKHEKATLTKLFRPQEIGKSKFGTSQ